VFSKGDSHLCSGNNFQSKVREENGRTTSKLALIWRSRTSEQALSAALLHRPKLLQQPPVGPAAPGGHGAEQSCCLSLLPKKSPPDEKGRETATPTC